MIENLCEFPAPWEDHFAAMNRWDGNDGEIRAVVICSHSTYLDLIPRYLYGLGPDKQSLVDTYGQCRLVRNKREAQVAAVQGSETNAVGVLFGCLSGAWKTAPQELP
ncbi:MAG: hypothetical protein F4Z84_05695 [Gammaproteobacteria bacterium]|nr:hypothetical protein [Gammaproteobacteria bacterium]